MISRWDDVLEFPHNQRHEAIGRLAAGESIRHVAQHFNVHYTAIARLVNRVQHTGTVRDGT